MIHLVAEMQNLKANPNVPARGHAIEAHLARGRGPVATLIVQKGTLKPGQAVVCGAAWARVRTMLDENGQSVLKAGPAQPVQVSGWSRLPQAGDEFFAVKDEREAKRISQEREARQRAADFVAGAKPATLEDISQAPKGLLAPEEQEFVLGAAQVRATFRIPRAVVAGCYVTEGKIVRGSRARLLRDGTVVYTGRIDTLKRFKDDVREVAAG